MKSDTKNDGAQNPAALPSHVAIIMDGNGRWAKKKLLNRVKGHEQGSQTVRTIVTACTELGIGTLTLYAFSTENWARPKAEVKALMILLKKFIVSERDTLTKNNIRLNIIGQKHRLPVDVQKEGDISEDDSFKAQKQVQDLTDEYIKKLDAIFAGKEKEILEV